MKPEIVELLKQAGLYAHDLKTGNFHIFDNDTADEVAEMSELYLRPFLQGYVAGRKRERSREGSR